MTLFARWTSPPHLRGPTGLVLIGRIVRGRAGSSTGIVPTCSLSSSIPRSKMVHHAMLSASRGSPPVSTARILSPEYPTWVALTSSRLTSSANNAVSAMHTVQGCFTLAACNIPPLIFLSTGDSYLVIQSFPFFLHYVGTTSTVSGLLELEEH